MTKGDRPMHMQAGADAMRRECAESGPVVEEEICRESAESGPVVEGRICREKGGAGWTGKRAGHRMETVRREAADPWKATRIRQAASMR